MLKLNQVIGVSGISRTGKDTFFKLFNQKFPNSQRFALADELKYNLNHFFLKTYGIDILNCSPEEKELLRPILVAHGKIWRQKTNGRHWINLLEPKIRDYHKTNPTGIAVITDIRYDEYDKDEVSWLKNEMNGILVHIKRYGETEGLEFPYFKEKIFLEAPNDEEKRNDPKLQKRANYRIIWQNSQKLGTFEDLEIHVDEFLKWLNR